MKRFNKRFINIAVSASFATLLFLVNAAQAQNFANIMQPDATAEKSAGEQSPQADSTPTMVPLQAGAVPIVGSQMAMEDSTYTLGVNDVIEVMVARHPEVSKQYIINSEGKIQYEFVGDIVVAGLTKKEAKEAITKQLSTYIVNPEVTVTIVGYNSKVVYVIGEVGQPGKIFMRGDTITVREALLEAGLPLLTASTRKCPLITPSESGKAEQKFVDVFKLVYEGDLRENLVMKPGDTLYIPATVMAKAMRVISPVTQPVGAAAGAARPIATHGF